MGDHSVRRMRKERIQRVCFLEGEASIHEKDKQDKANDNDLCKCCVITLFFPTWEGVDVCHTENLIC